jgi:hypothetical protein
LDQAANDEDLRILHLRPMGSSQERYLTTNGEFLWLAGRESLARRLRRDRAADETRRRIFP